MDITKNLLANAILLLLLSAAACEAAQKHTPAKTAPHHAKVKKSAPRVAKRSNDKIFNVLQYGAKHDPNKDNAMAFIQAWKATCNYAGNARLIIPAGEFHASEMVFQGPCKNPAPLVQFIGTLKAVSDVSSYSEDFWMSFEKIDGLTITGTGILDGQGKNVWKYNDGGGSIFPANLKILDCTNVALRQINSLNPMGFHVAIVLSQNVRIRNVHLEAPEDSPNTDGFHISQSTTVRIINSVVGTGDDCVGMIQGSTDVLIKQLTCGPGHGISIGSLGKYKAEKDVKGITVTNCTLKNTNNGLRIKTFGGSPPSKASSMTFQDIIMHNVSRPIIIDQFYGSKKNGGSQSRVQISDVKYINIRGTSNSEVGVDLQCSKQVPCQGLQLSNIDLKYTGTKKLKQPFSSSCTNAKISYSGKQFPPACR